MKAAPLAFAAWLAVSTATPAGAQEDAVTAANRDAYHAAIRCFIANGRAEGMRTQVGDVEKAAYYQSKAHQSFDAAVKLGGLLHLSGNQVTEDLELAQVRDLPPMVSDQKFFFDVVSTCKALGLM